MSSYLKTTAVIILFNLALYIFNHIISFKDYNANYFIMSETLKNVKIL